MKRTQSAVLVVASIGSFLTAFMSASINVALPVVGSELAADAILLSWTATAYLLTASAFLVPFGRLSDIIGRCSIFVSGLIIYTLASGLCAIVHDIFALIAFRGLQGLGGSMIYGTIVAMLVSAFPQDQTGKVIGISIGAVYAGLSLGPFIGGIMTSSLGWRSIFVVNALIGILAIIIALFMLNNDWQGAEVAGFDFIGTALYISMLALVVYGLSDISQRGIITLGGIILLPLFVLWESRVDSPILDVSLFKRSRVYSLSNFAALLNYAGTFGVGFLLSFFMQYAMGLGPQEAGFILIFQPVLMTIFSPIAGRLSDKIQPRILASTGMGLAALSLSLFSLIDGDATILGIAANLALLGFGLALFSSPNTNAIMSSISTTSYGEASATMGTMRVVGQTTSMALVTVAFHAIIGPVQITPPVIPSLIYSIQLIFTVFSMLCFISMLVSIIRGTVERQVERI